MSGLVPQSWLDRLKREADERDDRCKVLLDRGCVLNRHQQALVKKKVRRS